MESRADAPGSAQGKPKRGALTKQSILAAAAREFAAKGYEGASVRAIARASGVELALVQYHFGDKLALWGSTLDAVMGDFQDEVEKIFVDRAERRAAERVADFIEFLIRHAVDDPVYVGILSHARLEGSPDAQAFRDRLRPRSQTVIEAIRQAQEDGDFVPGDAGILFYNMVGAALRIFMNAADLADVTGRNMSAPGFIDEHILLCVRLFMPDLSPRTDGLWSAAAGPGRQPVNPVLSTEERPTSARTHAPPGPSTFYLLSNVEAALRRRLDQQLKVLNLTQAQMIALIRMASEHRLSSARLARMLDVTAQTVTLFVKALEGRGFIRREVDPASRRVRQIEITPEGARVLEDLRRIVSEAELSLMDGLSFNERAVLRDLLERILRRHRPLALTEWSPLIDRK